MRSTISQRANVSGAGLLLALLIGVTSPAPALAVTPPDALAPPAECDRSLGPTTPPSPPAVEKSAQEHPASDGFVRTELFFGSERPNLPEVSAREFKQFLDTVVTPCFPDGLTLLTGKGQFRESDGDIVQETSFVLVLLYPLGSRAESDVKIEAIRTIYRDRFQQESVLLVDDARTVRVVF